MIKHTRKHVCLSIAVRTLNIIMNSLAPYPTHSSAPPALLALLDDTI